MIKMLSNILGRVRAWLAWRHAQATAADRINAPAPAPHALVRRPAIINIEGARYFRDNSGNLWRVRQLQRDEAGRVTFIVGKHWPRVADPATGRVGPCLRLS